MAFHPFSDDANVTSRSHLPYASRHCHTRLLSASTHLLLVPHCAFVFTKVLLQQIFELEAQRCGK